MDAIDKMPPRTVTFGPAPPPLRIFSDGACEGEEVVRTTCGAVMLDTMDGSVEAFGATMGKAMVDLLSEGGKKRQLIGQAEILPMLVARMLWSGRMEGRDILHYVDNDAARFATIRGSSPSRGSAWMVHAFWESEIANHSCLGCQKSPRFATWGTALQEMIGKNWPRSTPTTRGLSGAKLKKRPSSGSGGGRSRR